MGLRGGERRARVLRIRLWGRRDRDLLDGGWWSLRDGLGGSFGVCVGRGRFGDCVESALVIHFV